MKLDLSPYLNLQAHLDATIHTQHGVTRAGTRVKRGLALIVEIAELANETRSFKYWSLKGPSSPEVLLEELSDTIHFTLSLALDLGLTEAIVDNPAPTTDLTTAFIAWTRDAVRLTEDFTVSNYKPCLDAIGTVADLLGLSPEGILDAYNRKNEKNHQRQKEAY